MRIAICDDEADQREVMLSFVRQYNPTLAVDAYDAAIDLLLAVEQIPYDIVFKCPHQMVLRLRSS